MEHKKFIKTLKEMTESLKDVRQSCLADAQSKIQELDDPKMKVFFEQSLKSANDGNLTAEKFTEQFKNMTDGRG